LNQTSGRVTFIWLSWCRITGSKKCSPISRLLLKNFFSPLSGWEIKKLRSPAAIILRLSRRKLPRCCMPFRTTIPKLIVSYTIYILSTIVAYSCTLYVSIFPWSIFVLLFINMFIVECHYKYLHFAIFVLSLLNKSIRFFNMFILEIQCKYCCYICIVTSKIYNVCNMHIDTSNIVACSCTMYVLIFPWSIFVLLFINMFIVECHYKYLHFSIFVLSFLNKVIRLKNIVIVERQFKYC